MDPSEEEKDKLLDYFKQTKVSREEIREKNVPRILYASLTHSQLKQVVKVWGLCLFSPLSPSHFMNQTGVCSLFTTEGAL